MENEIQPYVGPRPFELKDKAFFFGRDYEVNELVSLTVAHQLTLVYAQSGAGKTSLLNARLIPRLREEKYEVLPPARVQGAEHEEAANIYVYNTLQNWSAGQYDPQELEQMTLANFLETQPHAVNKITSEEEWEMPRFLFFDQFEELFTFYPHRWKERQDFFEQVRDALERDHLLRVVFVMREDYIAELDPYLYILPGKLRNRFRIRRLDEKAALQAITKPLINTKRSFADDAAELLVKNLLKIPLKSAGEDELEIMGQFVEPVQLQVVCQSLWNALKPDEIIITRDHVESFGDVNRALTDFYEKAISRAAAVPGVREGGVRRWFEDVLITADGTRGIVFRARESQKVAGLPIAAVDLLKEMQIIREKWRGQAQWYELAHDRLIEPIRKSNKNWEAQWVGAEQIRKRFEAKAVEWRRLNRSNAALLSGVELLEAERWLASPEAAELTYSDKLRDLVRSSRVAIDEEANQREVHQARALASEQQRRAEAERQRARQFKWGLIATSLLLIFAFWQWNSAYKAQARAVGEQMRATEATKAAVRAKEEEEKQREIAVTAQNDERSQRQTAVKLAADLKEALEREQGAKEEEKVQRVIAQQQTAVALTAKDKLKVQNDALDKERKIAESREIAAHAISQLPTDPQLSLLLALEASTASPTEQANDALRQSYLKSSRNQVLEGHSDTVWRAAFGPDDKFIVTISGDSTARIWDPKTNKERFVLKGHKGPIHALTISPDGKRIATEAADSTANVWDSNSGKLITTLHGLEGPVAAIAFNKDGTRLVSETKGTEGSRGEAKIWDATSGAELATLLGHERAIAAVTYSLDGRLIATASWDGTARIWNADTGSEKRVLRGHQGPVNSVAFSPDGTKLLTGSDDNTTRIWNVETGSSIELRGLGGAANSAMFSRDGKYIVTASRRLIRRPIMVSEEVPPPSENVSSVSEGTTARVWEVSKGKRVAAMRGHESDVYTASFSPDGTLVVTASADGTARVWDATTGESMIILRGHTGPVYTADFSSDGKRVVTASADGTARVWEVKPRQKVTELAAHKGEICNTTFTPDGMFVVTAGRDGRVNKSKNGTWETTENIEGDTETVYDTVLSPDGKFVVTASRIPSEESQPKQVAIDDENDDKSARVLEVATGIRRELKEHSHPVYKVAFSPNSQFLATTERGGATNIWNTSEWRKIKELPGTAADRVVSNAFSADGRFMITTSGTGKIRLWDTTSWVQILERNTHTGSVYSASFSPDGNFVVTTGGDGTVRIWDTQTWQNVRELRGHTGAIYDAKFSSDGRLMVTAGVDNTARVWEVHSGEKVVEFRAPDEVHKAAFSPDGKFVVIGSNDGVTQVFACEVCRPAKELPALASTHVSRELTEGERTKFLHKTMKGANPH